MADYSWKFTMGGLYQKEVIVAGGLYVKDVKF